MPPLDFILTALCIFLPLIFAFLCLYYSFRFLQAANNIENTPISKIRSAAQGYVELSGISKPLNNEPIYAKLTRKPCAWYYYKVENLVTHHLDGERKSIWNILDQGTSQDPFILEDDTGQCAILPASAEIVPSTQIIWRGHSRIPSSPPTTFLGWLLWGSWGPYRYTETRLELGESLYVSGIFYAVEKKHPYLQNNSIINRYFNETLAPTLNILTQTGMPTNQHFIISTVSQARLIRKFKFKSLIFLLAFLFFIILPVYSYSSRLEGAMQHWQSKKMFKTFKLGPSD